LQVMIYNKSMVLYCSNSIKIILKKGLLYARILWSDVKDDDYK